MKAHACFTLLGVSIISVPAQAALPVPPPKVAANTVLQPPARPAQVTFPDGVLQLPGVVYASRPGYRPLTLDLYLPPEGMKAPAEGFPLVVYIHGGAWMVGMSQQMGAFVDFPGVLASLSARGYVVASLNYRLSGEVTWPGQPEDVATAIRWLRGNAKIYHIDPTRGVVWAVSAGGHLTGLAATAPDLTVAKADGADPYAHISTVMQAAVSWYGVFDLSTISEQAKLTPGARPHDVEDAAEWKMLGCFDKQCPAGLVAQASPVTHVNASSPPMLLIAGTADRTVPYQQSVEMADALKKAGVEHTLILMPNLDHGLIGKTQKETETGSLEALSKTFDFIDQTMHARK